VLTAVTSVSEVIFL